MYKQLFEIFKAVTIEPDQRSKVPVFEPRLISRGLILNFRPTESQIKCLVGLANKSLTDKIRVLFARKSIDSLSLGEKIYKQVLHYFTSQQFPDLFVELEVLDEPVKFQFVKGLTVDEVKELIKETKLYKNIPLNTEEVKALTRVIKEFGDDWYDFNLILNNELKMSVFNPDVHKFSTGDELLRFVLLKATSSPLLIKDKKTLDNLKSFCSTYNTANVHMLVSLLENNREMLAKCFNRHKPIFMSMKHKVEDEQNNRLVPKYRQALSKQKVKAGNKKLNAAVNKIAKLSKSLHEPLKQPEYKNFFANFSHCIAMKIAEFPTKELFKLLNLCEIHRVGLDTSFYQIRNGKVFYEPKKANQKAYQDEDFLIEAEQQIIDVLKDRLKPLRTKRILLPKHIDYGLPISGKQTLGGLPFGTVINSAGGISSGIHWFERDGARDLDLSAVDLDGLRTGWGQVSSYNSNRVKFSGDLTSAPEPNGSMEFLTSSSETYGLFVNVFSGQVPCQGYLVVGSASEGKWIKDPIIHEKFQLDSKGNLLGFVKNKKFIVYKTRLNNNHISSPLDGHIVNMGLIKMWTINDLLSVIDYDWDLLTNEDPHHDLSYENITFDKLVKLFEVG
jgi:hypothetical protein